MRCFEKTDQRLIKRLATIRIDETLQAQDIWRRVVCFSDDQSPQDCERIQPADSDHANATAAGRSGQSNNGIVRSSHESLVNFDVAEEGGVSVGGSQF